AIANIATGRAAERPIPLDRPAVETAFDSLYRGGDQLSVNYREGRAARVRIMGELRADMDSSSMGAPAPNGFINDADRLARLIRRDDGIRLAFLALGGWDTHINQGGPAGPLAGRLKALGEGLSHFVSALGDAYRDTVFIVISEFGRTVHQNGNGGTDHGHG